MKVDQKAWTAADGWRDTQHGGAGSGAQLVLLFGATSRLREQAHFEQLRAWYPAALIVGCSTSGEICGTEVRDDSLVATALWFEHTTLHMAHSRREIPTSEPE